MAQGRQLLSDRVRDQLMSKILDGSVTVGSQLPPEEELCLEFGVSRATVREAVRGLVENGYLSRVHGSGTYVSFRPGLRHSLDRNLSYTELIRGAGMRPGRTVLRIERRSPSDEEAVKLRLKATDSVVQVERVRLADDQPVIYSQDTIPQRILGDVDDRSLSGSLYELFALVGHRVGHGEALLEPTTASSREARALQVAIGTPLLSIEQVDFSQLGEAVMFSREWHRSGTFQLAILRRAT